MSIAVEFCDVTKRFPNASENAVNHVSFQVQEGELITILGTSGCGKTTLMKMVNRLYEPTSGIIKVFGENIMESDAVQLRRKIGYVIQQIGLFPHMTVEKNIAVVPEILGWDKKENPQPGSRTFGNGQPGTGVISGSISGTIIRRSAAEGGTCPGIGSGAIYYAVGRAFRGDRCHQPDKIAG